MNEPRSHLRELPPLPELIEARAVLERAMARVAAPKVSQSAAPLTSAPDLGQIREEFRALVLEESELNAKLSALESNVGRLTSHRDEWRLEGDAAPRDLNAMLRKLRAEKRDVTVRLERVRGDRVGLQNILAPKRA